MFTVTKYVLWFLSTGIAFAGAWIFKFTEDDPDGRDRKRLTRSGKIALPIAVLSFILALILQVAGEREAKKSAEKLDLDRKTLQTKLDLAHKDLGDLRVRYGEIRDAVDKDPEMRRRSREQQDAIAFLASGVSPIQAEQIDQLRAVGRNLLSARAAYSDVVAWEDRVHELLATIGPQVHLLQYHKTQLRGDSVDQLPGLYLDILKDNIEFLSNILRGGELLEAREACELLFSAIHGRNLGLVKTTTDAADVNCRQKYSGTTALHLAVNIGNRQIVRFLLGRGADVDGADNLRRTPIMAAVSLNRPAILTDLLQFNPLLDLEEDNGTTALMKAASLGYTAMVSRLLTAGAEPDYKSKKEGSNAIYAIMERRGCPSSEHLKIMDLLSDRGADCDVKVDGATPLTWAVQNNCPTAVTKLLSCGASLSGGRYPDGSSYIEKARELGYTEVIEALENRS